MSSKQSKEYSPADENFNSMIELFWDTEWNAAFELIQSHNEVATMIDESHLTALHEACFYGAPLRIIDLLIRINPAAIKAKKCHGHLPLHLLFCGPADPAVVKCMLETDPSAAKAQDNFGNLPLHCAAGNFPPKSFEILLAAYPEGACVADDNGDLPLHNACYSLLKHDNLCQILRLLIQANPAAVSSPNNQGRYPFHTMLQEIVGTLNPESMRGFNMVLDATSDVARTPCPFYNGGLPLHYLLDNPPTTENFSDSWSECVAILLKAHPGALIFSNDDSQLPLHIAVKKWPFDEDSAYDEDGEFLDNPPPAEELSDYHCQLIETLIKVNPSAASIPDNEGRLALHLACMHWPRNVKERLSVLLAANMNALDHVDIHGKTPLQYAFERESDAHEFVAGIFSVTKQVQLQKFQHTIIANEGLSVGLAGARKGLDKEREKVRSLEEEIAQLRAENAQLRS